MDVPILVCGCGMRIKAPGARPGRVGRCPACGGRLEVPETPVTPGRAGADDRFRRRGRTGFGPPSEIVPDARPASASRRGIAKRSRPRRGPSGMPNADGRRLPAGAVEARERMADQLPLPAPRRGEPGAWSRPSASSRWIFGVLVTEYCIQAMADTSSMGASLLGMLFVLIAVLPVVFLGPMCLSYWLQYLGRVLVSSAMGECARRGRPTATSTASSTA